MEEIWLTIIMEKSQELIKNAENWYYLVKCTSGSYTFQSSHNIGRYVIKSSDLMCGAVYLNPFANFKQWYIPYEKTKVKQLSGWILLF